MADLVTTIPSREDDGTRTYHLAKGPTSADWQEIHCGGGIALPGPRARVAAEDVCPACVKVKGQR